MQRLSVFALACLATLTLGLPALAEGRTKRGHHKPAHARQSRVDRDRDGLTNSFERHRSHTRPNRRDTDRDGLTDGYEVRRSRTNPRRRDTDGDGLSDRYEVRVSHTDPRRKDAPVHTPPDTPIDDGSTPSSPASPPPPPPPPPPPAAKPVVMVHPWISRKHHVLTCHPGTWSNHPTSRSYRWTLKGRAVGSRRKLKVRRPLRGRKVVCRVTAANAAGSTTAASRAFRVPRGVGQ